MRGLEQLGHGVVEGIGLNFPAAGLIETGGQVLGAGLTIAAVVGVSRWLFNKAFGSK